MSGTSPQPSTSGSTPPDDLPPAPSQIAAAVEAARPILMMCFQDALGVTRKTTMTAIVALTIDGSGRITDATDATSEPDRCWSTGCVAGTIKSDVKLPSVGAMRVKVPFELRCSARGSACQPGSSYCCTAGEKCGAAGKCR